MPLLSVLFPASSFIFLAVLLPLSFPLFSTLDSHYECIGTVRLTPEAEKVVRRLKAKTGLPIRQIVSEIIVQSESLITINTDDEEPEN